MGIHIGFPGFGGHPGAFGGLGNMPQYGGGGVVSSFTAFLFYLSTLG